MNKIDEVSVTLFSVHIWNEFQALTGRRQRARAVDGDTALCFGKDVVAFSCGVFRSRQSQLRF